MKKALFILSVILISCANEETTEPIQQESWARPAQQGGTTAAYFTVQNDSEEADTLLSVHSAIAELAQIHESYETEDGLMGMREVPMLIFQPEERVEFKRGGYHVMLINLKENLESGDTLRLQLNWSNRGDALIMIPVKTSGSEVVHDH